MDADQAPLPRWQRAGAALGGLLFLAFSLGCMSLSFGGRTELLPIDGTCGFQTGKASLAGHEEAIVYYPVPFQSPPNLEVKDTWHHCRIVDQQPDHFRLKNCSSSHVEATWKARGLRVVPAPCPPVVIPVGTTETVPPELSLPREVLETSQKD